MDPSAQHGQYNMIQTGSIILERIVGPLTTSVHIRPMRQTEDDHAVVTLLTRSNTSPTT